MIQPGYHSYRDPVARVVKKPDGWYRYIFTTYQKEFDHLTSSGLYRELVEKGLLIRHQETEPDVTDPGIYKMIRPEQIAFQSYPFEWSYTQWQKALLTFLEINLTSLKYGMLLKDATPFNFYLEGGRAVLLDTSSFAFFNDNDHWKAYRQFCEVFLSPFALMHFNGAKWSGLTAGCTRGLPLAFVSKQLSWSSWFNFTSLVHIHWHAKFTKVASGKKDKKGFSAEKLSGLLSMIRSAVSAWKKPYPFKGHWPAYYEQHMESYLAAKEAILNHWLLDAKPKTVIDLGANTGRFSFLAAKHAGYVIALDKDDACVDHIQNEIEKQAGSKITVLTGDLAEPTSGLGMINKEYASIFTRGRSDMVFGLALVHHLCIGMNIPFSLIAEMFSLFADRFAIVEFIPRKDEKVTLLLANRDDIFADYNEENFVSAFSLYFELVAMEEAGNSKRKLFLWKKR